MTEEIKAVPEIKEYFEKLNLKVKEQYDLARKAREKGLDLSREVECIPVLDLAERTESIIGPKGIAKRYRELFEELKGDRMQVIFTVFKEIIEEKWNEIPDESKRIEQAIKTCLVIETEGVVVAPLDGVPKIQISRNLDGSRYVDIYFAGPIRAAGGSSTVLPLILGDYARKLLDLDRYKPTEEEVERYVEEIMIYQTEIFSRQYTIPEEEIRIIVRGCPVCINGVPTEEKEVSVHRDLERIPSNRIRGGMGLVISEGVALKAMKIMDWSKKLGLDWSWLEKIIKVKKSSETRTEIKPNFKYLDRIAAGRPLLCYPMKYGGFRLRYGRGRNTGIMGKGINPATMIVLDEFIAVGTHIRIERPGKAAQLFPCDSIDGPIVKLKNSSVMRLNSMEEAVKVKPQIEKILFLGDILVTLGDFRKSSHPLIPSSFVEEWFELELKKALKEKKLEGIKEKEIQNVTEITPFTAVELSMQLNVPLHPKYLHYYTALNSEEITELMKEARKAEKVFTGERITGVKFELKEKTKGLMEKIGLPHKIKNEKITVEEEFAYPLLKTLGALSTKEIPEIKEKKVLELLTEISGMKIMDKGASFVGARMGRPEQAKPREMKGNPHGLFPIGNYGGNTRSINKAIEVLNNSNKKLKVELSIYRCPKCTRIIPFPYCDKCNEETLRISKCIKCGWIGKQDETECHQCRGNMIKSEEREINLEEVVHKAAEKMKIRVPELVKGVKGLISDLKEPEPIEKAILRAKHGVHIFRDATSRFELLNAPITHFKPKEINLSVQKVKELGYSKDIKGKEIVSEEQIIEIFPQDIIVNETAGDWMLKVTAFIDELLEKFYGMKSHYNKTTKEELIGEIVIGLAPHTSAGIVGRIIGFSKARVGWGHPYFITCKRRNCLTGNTPVLIQNGRKMKSVPINYFDDNSEKEEIPLENVFAFTVDEKGILQTRKVNALLKQKSPEKLLKFKTRFGREITVTENHKLLAFDGTKVKEKEATEFSKGENLLALHSIKSNNTQKEFNTLEYYLAKPVLQKKLLRVHGLKKELKEVILKKGGYVKTAKRIKWRNKKALHTAIDFDSVPMDLFELLLKDMKKQAKDFRKCFIGYNKQKSTIPAVIPFNKELGEVLGYFLADGYSRNSRQQNPEKFVYQVNFVSEEKEITEKIEKTIKELFERNVSIQKRGKLDYITLSGRVYFEFFDEMLKTGSNAKNKRVPFLVLNSPKECLQGILAGYIVGDGHINSNSIKMTSVNQSLINDFGLVCNLLELFPHFINEKEREIKSGCLKEFYDKKGKTISIKAFGIRLYSEDLKKIGKYLFGKKKEKFKEIELTHEFRKKRIKTIGNFVLDKITKIEKIKSNEKWVYDLMVEGEKNYIAGFGNLGVYDCDGDQDSIMLLMDALLNFSEHYLPSSRGGRMDAPLVFTKNLNPSEIDNEVYEMETVSEYPLEFYYKTLDYAEPNLKEVEIVKKKLGKIGQYTELYFTHDTKEFDEGPKQSMYVQLKTMEEKIKSQARLQHKIAAVEEKDALERVLMSHFLPDIIGNTRAFSKQQFRCTACNTKYRRVPLVGKCTKCEGNLILTIAEGSVKKYLNIAREIINTYHLSDYLKQRIDLAEMEISSVFKNDKVEQKSLYEYV